MNEMALSEGQCQFYLKKKKRYCRFTPKLNATYCPEHACIMGIQEDRKRIPCPLNPNHNCYEDELQKHLKKCNVTKSRQAVEKLPYFAKDINKGSIQVCTSQAVSKLSSVKDLTSERLGAMIEKVNKLYSEAVEDVDRLYLEHPRIKEEIVGNLDQDLTKAFGDQAVLRKEMLQQASLVGQLENLGCLSSGHHFVELGAGKGKLSHWIHKASDIDVDNSFLLVERSSVRYKVDPFHKYGKGNEGKFERLKIDIQDFCLGKVPGIQSKGSVVVVGKHLCGGATDLGIRCAVNTLHLSPCSLPSNQQQCTPKSEAASSNSASLATDDSVITTTTNTNDDKSSECKSANAKKEADISGDILNSEPKRNFEKNMKAFSDDVNNEGEGLKNCGKELDQQQPPAKVARLDEEEQEQCKLQGIMIALCCHHRCTWDVYVGQEFMKRHGVNEEEFDLLTRLSSWATCARTRLRGKTSTKNSAVKSNEDTHSTTGAIASVGDKSTNKKDEVGEEVEEEEEHSVEDLIASGSGDDGVPLREKLTVSDREMIGRKAKRIIDKGRIEYLQSKNMNCSLREYISDEFTPENIVLIATAPKP